jgi:signal transduction histidine kinase
VSDGAGVRGTFPVVALGGSAGGLAPTLDLVRELGTHPGLTIVVIHHLDPTPDSGLTEILTRATSLPVSVATEGSVLEANHVYVVPSSADLLTGNSLRQELASTRQYLESVIEKLEATNEELKAVNEEVVSSNEALRSTNEELQSAQEKLQATNEELRVVNDEMRDRSAAATRLSDDLTNVLSSIELPILMVGRDVRLRKFTPAAAAAFGLLPTDLGRLLEEIEPALELAPDLPLLAKQGLDDLPVHVSLFQDATGRWRELTSHRYVGLDGRIDGTVIAARDVDAEKKVRECQEQLQSMAFDAALAEERERRRIAIELHDRMGQALALAEIKLTAIRGDLAAGPRAEIDAAVALLEQAITDTRVLVFELSPPLLYDLGLKEAICWLAEDVEKRHGIKVAVTDDATDKPLTDASKAILFRAVRELVMNVLNHSAVQAATVTLQRAADDIEVKVEDNGAGFEPAVPKTAAIEGGFGLFSVGEQVARLGGAMQVDSKIGRGTRVSVRVPLNLPFAVPTNAAPAAARVYRPAYESLARRRPPHDAGRLALRAGRRRYPGSR